MDGQGSELTPEQIETARAGIEKLGNLLMEQTVGTLQLVALLAGAFKALADGYDKAIQEFQKDQPPSEFNLGVMWALRLVGKDLREFHSGMMALPKKT